MFFSESKILQTVQTMIKELIDIGASRISTGTKRKQCCMWAAHRWELRIAFKNRKIFYFVHNPSRIPKIKRRIGIKRNLVESWLMNRTRLTARRCFAAVMAPFSRRFYAKQPTARQRACVDFGSWITNFTRAFYDFVARPSETARYFPIWCV